MRSELLPETRMIEIANETDELCRILGQSVVTARKNEDRKTEPMTRVTPK